MIVYMVFYESDYDKSDLVGVFSTRELAQARIDGYTDMDKPYLSLIEWRVDV